jgi:hypothetical protein
MSSWPKSVTIGIMRTRKAINTQRKQTKIHINSHTVGNLARQCQAMVKAIQDHTEDNVEDQSPVLVEWPRKKPVMTIKNKLSLIKILAHRIQEYQGLLEKSTDSLQDSPFSQVNQERIESCEHTIDELSTMHQTLIDVDIEDIIDPDQDLIDMLEDAAFMNADS